MICSNIEAWAMLQGYDPDHVYAVKEEPEPGEPPAAAQPGSAGLPPGYLSLNFTAAEFACKHCGQLPPQGMDPDLIDALQRIRDHYGMPVTINSGYRCPEHNAAVGGASNSQHLYGTAADIVVAWISPAKVYADLDPIWPGGLGKYSTFTHCDTRSTGAARWAG